MAKKRYTGGSWGGLFKKDKIEIIATFATRSDETLATLPRPLQTSTTAEALSSESDANATLFYTSKLLFEGGRKVIESVCRKCRKETSGKPKCGKCKYHQFAKLIRIVSRRALSK